MVGASCTRTFVGPLAAYQSPARHRAQAPRLPPSSRRRTWSGASSCSRLLLLALRRLLLALRRLLLALRRLLLALRRLLLALRRLLLALRRLRRGQD